MQTICRDCVFAVWDQNTQINCELDRLEKLEENGAKLLGQVDGDKTYIAIQDRFCNTCRNGDWSGAKLSKRKMKKQVMKEVELQCDIIVHVNPHNNSEEFAQTLESVLNQTICPKSVLVITHDISSCLLSEVIEKMRGVNGISWKVENEVATRIALKNLRGFYQASFQAGYEIPSDFIARLNNLINVDMQRFSVILPDINNNGMVIQKLLSDQFVGELDPIIELADEKGYGYMIKTWEELL